MMKQMLEMMKGFTAERLAESANYKLTIRMHAGMMERLNMSCDAAAEILGRMKIQINDDAYNADPETFDKAADELVRVFGFILDTYGAAWGRSAAYTFLKAGASEMSLTYG